MKILLDTNIFLWVITEDPRLSNSHRDLFLDDANDLYLSLASLWEMLIKAGIGKLPMPAPVAQYVLDQMQKNGIKPLSIRIPHLRALEALPPLHRDPFDRLLVAQAQVEKMPVLSSDPIMRQYGVAVL